MNIILNLYQVRNIMRVPFILILRKGDIINYEIIPKKINTANKILKSFYISEIIFFHMKISIFSILFYF